VTVIYRETGQFKTTYASDQQLFPILQDRVFVIGFLVFAFGVLPFIGTEYLFLAIIIPFLILSLAAIGLNILVGYCGQVSLGTGAFMSIGAYSAYNLAVRVPDLNLLVVFILAGVFATIVGVLFGIPSLRIKGFYLAVATLAAQFFVDWLFARVKWFTNDSSSGNVSAPPLAIFGYAIQTPVQQYLLVLAIVCVFALIARNLTRGAIGRSWMATRDMDVAAEVIGIRPLHAKLSAFAVSSFFIGVAGALWAFIRLGSWEPLAFDVNRSFQLLFMVIIGGLGSIMGSFVGAAFILILPIMLNLIPTQFGVPLSTETITHLEFIIFGSLICYLLIKEPHGFARLISLGKEKLRLWPFPY
jgi:branched-chain amino acid transport system permease protein